MQDVSARKGDAAGARAREFRMDMIEARHVVRRIAGPALAPNVLIEPAIAVGADVQTSDFLLPQVDR